MDAITLTINAAPPELREKLRTLARDVSVAIIAFGRSCDRADIRPPVSLAHCSAVVMATLAINERDARADYSELPPFRAEAFGQRAVTAALEVIEDAVAAPAPVFATPRLRRMN